MCEECYYSDHPFDCDVTKRECLFCKKEFFIEDFYECSDCLEGISCKDCFSKVYNGANPDPDRSLLSCLECKHIYHRECYSFTKPGRMECLKCKYSGCKICGYFNMSPLEHKCFD